MAVLDYTPQAGVLPVDQELTLAKLAQRLSGPENALMTRGIGGILGMAQMARDYDYPDTALGLLSLPAKAVTGLGDAMMLAPAGMIDSANEQVAGLGDGSEVTEGALGMLGMGGVLGNMPKGALGANVFQGGPNKYGPEGAAKSLDYMGKGEGAQAYGYGRYDAEAEEVGKQYKEFLGTRNADLTDPGNRAASAVYRTPEGTVEAGIQEMKAAIRAADNSPNAFPKGENELNKQALSYLESGKELPSQEGYLYKHDLPDEDIARYLDWDAPLSEQGDIGQRAMDALKVAEKPSAAQSAADKDLLDQLAVDLADFDVSGPHPYEGMTGAQLYNQMQNTFGSSSVFSKNNAAQQAASEALGRAGIPGLKYYDGMSRKDGEGTRNFVTWDQDVLNRMKLLERNGEKFSGLLAPNTITKSAAIDASDIFGAGAKKVKYVDPPSGGYIEILQRENGPSSVLDLQVPEEYRRQGIGKLLQESAINDNPKLMGQVSSKYAAKSAYDLGRRPFDNPTATMDDVLKSIDQDSSVNMIIDKTEIPGGQLPSIEEKRAKISALRAEANAQRFGYDINDPVQSNAANISSAAKKHFGVTSNPSETGYILPDGTRLDLSGRHNAGGYVRSGDKFMAEPGKPDYLANSRNTDHRELFDVEGIKESDHQWGAVEQFLTETGAIRYIPDQGISIIKGQPVSDRQLKSIVNDFRKSGNPLNVDIDPVGGWSKSKSKYFERPTLQDVKDFINLNND